MNYYIEEGVDIEAEKRKKAPQHPAIIKKKGRRMEDWKKLISILYTFLEKKSIKKQMKHILALLKQHQLDLVSFVICLQYFLCSILIVSLLFPSNADKCS